MASTGYNTMVHCLPYIDLTQNVAVLFIFGFFCILGAIFILMCSFLIPEKKKPGHILYKEFGSYLIFELLISVMILVFVMYHAQTIQGSRFAEMRLNDFLLASLILFHDFLIIYWLTFYWQYKEKPFTPDKILRTTSDPTGTPDDDDSKSASRRIIGKHTAAQKHTETTLQTVIEVTDDYYDATIVTSSKDSEVESSIEVSKSTDVDYYFDIEVSKSTIVTSSRAREVESSIEVSKSTDVDYYFDIEVSKSTDVDYYFDIREVPLAMTHDSSDTIFGITGDSGDEPSEFFGDESIMSNNKKEEQDLYAPQHTSEPLTITFDFMEDGIATASKSMIQRRWDRITKDDSDMFINIKKPTDNHISTEELRRYNVKETEIEFM
ncbi:uncharacterized protein LOC133841633 isoform X2 [Drosophila sulfurigaster albostrigata]|uniref:uncharacterized protein LOC133841633 isoform X2 n=1 Tax=Drosophila sulfurigaster albostrigata TaxID=89887 RepID=UPI002D21CAE5|nr:uncharacterized protein LOC133841633 isoform X2 [Drosophila sulfurigaster albostrigata]